jgi:exonuclease VII large subunit
MNKKEKPTTTTIRVTHETRDHLQLLAKVLTAESHYRRAPNENYKQLTVEDVIARGVALVRAENQEAIHRFANPPKGE